MPIVGVWSVPATAFDAPDRVGQLGVGRIAAVPRTLRLPAEQLLLCEFDRLLTWAERHLDGSVGWVGPTPDGVRWALARSS